MTEAADKTLQINGDFTVSSIRQVALLISEQLPCTTLNLDLAQVEGTDSTAIQLLLAIKKHCDKNGSKFSISHIPDVLANQLDAFHVAHLFTNTQAT